MSPMYSGHNAMIEPDDDEDWGEGTGSPCDRALDLFLGVGWIIATIALSYAFTR
jgi:hypothetical protein